MGSIDCAASFKPGPLLSPPPYPVKPPHAARRLRSRLTRFLLFERVDFLQWLASIAAFCLVVVAVQTFLPSQLPPDDPSANRAPSRPDGGALPSLDFGEAIDFVPSRLLKRWERECREEAAAMARLVRVPIRSGTSKPRLAMVFPDLYPDAIQLQMLSIASALLSIGYEVEVFALENGPVAHVWNIIGVAVQILLNDVKRHMYIDWLDYKCILVSSIEARPVLASLLQDPLKSIPVIWSIHDNSLALRAYQYNKTGFTHHLDDWKDVFDRATVVVFPNHALPVIYSTFDSGNYFVIPGSPAEALQAYSYPMNDNNLAMSNVSGTKETVIVMVGSRFMYSGMLVEHALVLDAVAPLLRHFSNDKRVNLRLVIGLLSHNLASSYKMAFETIASNAGCSRDIVELAVVEEDVIKFLAVADVVIYGSFLDEQSFPNILLQAFNLRKLVIAPELTMIKKIVDDGVNGYLYPKEDIGVLSRILYQALPNGKLSFLGQKIASAGKAYAKNALASDSILGYASLLENVVKLPAEFHVPLASKDIPVHLIDEWQWALYENLTGLYSSNTSLRGQLFLEKLEQQFQSKTADSQNTTLEIDDAFSHIYWEEERKFELFNSRRRLEEEELKDRSDQPHGSWEEIYRNVKRADRGRNELHDRDDNELERVGQPLCIYEPFLGEGAWPFLHQTPLYRGIGLSTRKRRPGADDIDASSRLPLLNSTYYRDILGEYGAYFALANRIDRIHKHAWIGFQSWRATAGKKNLSKVAESQLLDVIQSQMHGDALYFWARLDQDRRNSSQQDFWSFCDYVNAGNCRHAVSIALQRMYGIKNDINFLPPMPNDGGTWSVMHSWVLPTRSFLEFVMFSRMFVDALDAQMYDMHYQSGYCYLSLHKDRNCYARLLELLVNIWAYHSARRMVYVDPHSGAMQEQHHLNGRHGRMWIRWLSYSTLKSMDEELAEKSDCDYYPGRRWLWPNTGEVFWQGVHERERNLRQQEKERKKQQNKDKIQRIRKRARQKTLGKYIKPPPEAEPEGTIGLNRTS